jgi:pheromone shutdown-related protein TraB
MESSTHDEPTVKLTLGNSNVTLLGTAHVSRKSADTVAKMIDSGDYDAIAIELCESRYNTLNDPDSLAKMDLFKVVREGKAPMVMASLALGAFQQRLADQFGIDPGAEMRVAMQKTDALKIPLHLIDREVGITLKRVYRAVPWWQRMSIFSGLIASAITREEIEEKDIERLKEGDMLESTFQEFAQQNPNLYVPLINERDEVMSSHIYQTLQSEKPQNLLAVVGAGHLKGIEKYLLQLQQEKPSDTTIRARLAELNSAPPKSKLWSLIPWLIVAIILLGFAIGFSRSSDLGWELVRDWVLINGGLSSIGALLAAAHPLTILGAFVAAPLTSLNPTIGAGMVTGAIEAMLRRPQVEDFSKLKHDTTHWTGWWKNRVSKVLLVFFFCTLGSAIGTYVAGFRIFDKLVN